MCKSVIVPSYRKVVIIIMIVTDYGAHALNAWVATLWGTRIAASLRCTGTKMVSSTSKSSRLLTIDTP